ncbi:hypothetical protein [Neobacillus sp. 204]
MAASLWSEKEAKDTSHHSVRVASALNGSGGFNRYGNFTFLG